jgi:protocatechuate 3,4-dioxygenase beta subunit
MGRCLTDQQGVYRFTTIRPGAYPWLNHANAWRPAHIHFSVFGPSTVSRLVTQMYFPDDPLHALDPIMNSIPTQRAREALIAGYDHEVTEPEWALGYRWEIVLAGAQGAPFEDGAR